MTLASRTDLPNVEHDACTLTIRTLSKSHGPAGPRLTFLLGSPEIVDLVARTRVANGLSSIAIDFLLFALAERALFAQIISDVADWRDAFQEHLRRARPGLWVPASGGNFVMFDLGSSDAAESFARSLAERRLRIRLFPEAASFASCARVTAAPLPDLDRVLA